MSCGWVSTWAVPIYLFAISVGLGKRGRNKKLLKDKNSSFFPGGSPEWVQRVEELTVVLVVVALSCSCLQSFRLMGFCNAALIRCFPLSRKAGGLLPAAILKLIKQQKKGIVLTSSENVILVVINGIWILLIFLVPLDPPAGKFSGTPLTEIKC